MKTIIHTILVFIAMQSVTSAQCAINYKEILDNKCSGVYLRHQDFSNTKSNELNLVLTKDNTYSIYLLNPSRSLPNLKVSDNNTFSLLSFRELINSSENYSVYTLVAGETGEYRFGIDFHTDEKACVLLAIYLQNTNSKSGIYKSFDEFRYDNPSIELNCQVVAKKHSVWKGQETYYKLDLDSKNRRAIGKVFGFCDGKEVYIALNYPNPTINPEFIKMENLYKYYFYEYVKYIPIFSGSMGTMVPSRVQMILDVNTGEVRTLNKKALCEIMANDQSLLDEFNNSKGKERVKEYLIKYVEKHYNN
jgi:hypothetical protein